MFSIDMVFLSFTGTENILSIYERLLPWSCDPVVQVFLLPVLARETLLFSSLV